MTWHTTAKINPDQVYVLLATRLEMESFWQVPKALWHSSQTIAQLRRSHGLLGFRLFSGPLSKVFYSVSAWQNEKSLSEFCYANPYANRIMRLQSQARSITTKHLKLYGSELPPSVKKMEIWFT